MSQRFKITEAPQQGRALEQKNKPMFTILQTFHRAFVFQGSICAVYGPLLFLFALPALNEKRRQAKLGWKHLHTHVHVQLKLSKSDATAGPMFHYLINIHEPC